MTNFVDSEQVINKPKASKKSKSSHLDDGASPTRHTDKDDVMLPAEEMDFHIWSESEDDMCEATRAYKSQPEDEVQNEEDDDLLDGYESDNGDYGPLLDSEDEHSFSRMSHTLYKCPFRVYAALQNWGKCFQIQTLHNIHTCKGLDNNLKDYANVIKQQIPGVLALLKVTNHDTPANKCEFQRIMVNFLGLRYGFNEGCRPFIGLDGYHLKGHLKKHRKNLAAASGLESSFTGVNSVGNSASDGSAAEPSLNTSTPTPKQSTRGSATKETAGISRGKNRRKNASTTTNTAFDQFSVPPTSGIKIREGDKYGGTTSQFAPVQTKRDLKGKAVA
ncbi:hypothetical protein WN944_014930 [Citrus x changshan-huyou]|uniref:Uncharacterized protein n=1 Tax=Citrus x changshan-huyou TaxID=2935761 RepID=A0AAP0M8S0_9ROSI